MTCTHAHADEAARSSAGGDITQESHGLEEVVVTAQRREENLQKAAIAVSAVTGDVLTEQSVTQATDLARIIPSIQIAPATAFMQIYLRGVGTFGSNAFADQGVAFNYDGVYLSRPSAPAGMFYDLERIEVLKGPQGTLYGRNASGGAVNVLPVKPAFGALGGFLTAEYGDYDAIKASGALNVPVGERAAFRLAAQHAERDGYYNDGYDDEDSDSVRAQFRFDSGNGFNLNLGADYAQAGGQGGGGTIMPLLFDEHGERLGPSDPRVLAAYVSRPPTPPVPQILARPDGYLDNEFIGLQATLDADLGFATLTVVPAYRETNIDMLQYASGFLIDVIDESQQTSIEARLANQSDALNWVLGAYWFDEDIVAEQFYSQASNGTTIDSDLQTESFAVFGQGTYSLTDTFRVTGGIRYTRDNKQQDTEAHTLPFVGFVNPAGGNFTPIILDIPTFALTDVDFSKVTWKAGIEYDLGPNSLLYASVATGFKSGILYSAVGRNYSEPEELTAYTLGSKNRFLDNTLQLNLEAFYWDYKDQQVSHLGPVQVAVTPGGPIFGPVFLTENAGSATIYGLEAELLWQPTDNDRITLNAQYLDTEYDTFRYQAYSVTGAPPALGCSIAPTTLFGASPQARVYDVDCSGRPLTNAPEWTLNVGYDRTFSLGDAGRIIAGVDTRVEAERYLSIDFLALGQQDDYMMSNARLTYENKPGTWAVTAFINNIEDELVFSNSLQSPAKAAGAIYNQIRPPRTYGVRATFRF